LQRKILARLGAAAAVAAATAMVLAPSAFASNTNLIPAPALGPFGVGPLEPGGPGVNDTISASCPSGLVTAAEVGSIGFQFTDGNAHAYGDLALGKPIGVGTGGANAEGDAILFVDGTPTAAGFLHAWVGYNTNPNGPAPGSSQYVMAQTIAFTGSITSTGQSVSLNANPGSATSASGNQNSWGELTLDCS
jgi:hypothetical protein